MRILIAFIVAFAIGAASRCTGVPSLAPQAIIGALLIVAMSTGYVSADRLLKRNPATQQLYLYRRAQRLNWQRTTERSYSTSPRQFQSLKRIPHSGGRNPKLCNSSLPICYSRMSNYAPLKRLIAPRRRRVSDVTSRSQGQILYLARKAHLPTDKKS
jgi:XapX domain-containing protein